MASHKQLSNWYAQLGQNTEAGVTIADAFRISEGPPAKARLEMADRLENGELYKNVISEAPKWLPDSDRQFIIAGMETGRLPQIFFNLSARHELIGNTQLKVMLGLIYPIGVYHITALILPTVKMIDYENGFQWNLGQWLLGCASLIIPVWFLAGFIYYLARNKSPSIHRLLRVFPILSAYSKAQAIADLAYSLGIFVVAGIPIPSAWQRSVQISNDSRFSKASREMEPVFSSGNDPANTLSKFSCFPKDFVAMYKTGARNGQLDTTLFTIGRQYQARANNAMTLATIVYPTLIFVLVAVVIVMSIFQIYGGYLDIIEKLAGS
ncbi:MAG: type II secretion system F family protein [Opitutaceae bacterium]